MQPQEKLNESGQGTENALVCTQCGAPMPKEMRFCRSCGHRLGEGPAEYTETVHFPGGSSATAGPMGPGYTAPIASRASSALPYKRRRRLSGMTWVFIVIAFLFAFGGVMSIVKKAGRNIPPIAISPSRSYFGVDGFENAKGGVSFDVVEPPGGPADKAGLVGGDIITSFDGHAVTDEDEMSDLMRGTPIGKTVEVTYIRDGEPRKTQLTTISGTEFNNLESIYRGRTEGRGMFGFEDNRTTKISNPETKTYGIRLDYVEPNGPADLFGIRTGDIITEFGGVPIRTSDELLSRVRRAVPRTVVEVTILRDGQTLKIPVTMGRLR